MPLVGKVAHPAKGICVLSYSMVDGLLWCVLQAHSPSGRGTIDFSLAIWLRKLYAWEVSGGFVISPEAFHPAIPSAITLTFV
jgi:hypothetical protein